MNLWSLTQPTLALSILMLTQALQPAAAKAGNNGSQTSMTQKLFQVESQVLDNGLHIIRHHRDDSDTFSAQLVVDLGLADFNCKDKQTPHVLEHMVFEGTESYDRKALRQRVLDHGGKNQAFTMEEYTHFTLHVHSLFPQIALENLYSMVTESRFEQASFHTSQQVIHAEQGTNSASINPLWSSSKIMTNAAKAQIYSDTELYCEHLSNPDDVELEKVKQIYQSHYVASNMTLILIGHFNHTKLDALIDSTFGLMPLEPKPARNNNATPKPNYSPIREKRAVLDPQADLLLFVPAVGKRHPNAEAYEIIAEYFGEQLFYEVRGKKGLGYTPKARILSNSETGVLEASTGTTDQLLEKAELAFVEVYDRIRQQGISNRDIERIKRKLILRFEAKQRSNNEIAQLYRHHRHEIRRQGEMPNLVRALKQVNQQQINSLLHQFPSQPLIATLARPSLSRVLFYIILISVITTTLAWPFLRWVRKANKLTHD